MPFGLDVTSLSGRLNSVAESMQDLSQGPMGDAMLDVSDIYHEAMRQRFDAFTVGGGYWDELRPSTLAAKRGRGSILIDFGDMRESLERDGIDHILEQDSDGVTEGTGDFKAHFHQGGTIHMAQRTILVEIEEIPFVASAISDRIGEGINQVVGSGTQSLVII